MFKKILVPYDFSPSSEVGLAFARAMAEKGAAIHLVHVVDEMIPLPYAGAIRLDDLVQSSREKLKELTGKPAEGAKVTANSVSGWVWKAILDEARRVKADTIVMGSHGRKGTFRFLLGSVAERLIRESKVPLCVVKEEVKVPKKLRRIGLATDLGRASGKATDVAQDLALRHGATLHLIHVLESGRYWTLPEVALAGEGADPVELRKVLEVKVRKEAARLKGKGVKVQTALPVGEAPERIATYAAEKGLDLVVAGTHAHKGLDLFFLGSVAAHTVRIAPCPFLVVPGK